MTPHKALVVDDDPNIIDMVADVLDSIGHEHDATSHQAEARKFIEAGSYSYVLLDLEIPARGWHSLPRIQNSVNLLEQIRESDGMSKAPVIIMSDRTPDNSEVAVEMMRLAADLAGKKAVDYIHKPFPPAGRTLDRVIKKVLGENGTPRRRKPRRSSAKGKTPRSIPDSTKAADVPVASGEPQKKAAPEKSPWGHIPNEPVTLDQFMAKYCESRSKELYKCRRNALLAAARHKTVAMPGLAERHKRGKPKKYFTRDLLAAWSRFQDEGVDLPAMKPEYQSRPSRNA
jgi:CheY-like chemotaxis protein